MRQLACRVHYRVGRCIAISGTFGTFGVKSTGINKKAEKGLFFSASLRLYKRLLANLYGRVFFIFQKIVLHLLSGSFPAPF